MSGNLLKYLIGLRENFENVKNIEEFVADEYWEDTDYIPDSFKDGDTIKNPCFKYDADRVNQLDQACVQRVLSESKSPDQTRVLKKVFGIEDSVVPVNSVKETKPTVTTTEPKKSTEEPKKSTEEPKEQSTNDDNCSGNILNFECNKNLKILIWCLIALVVLLVFSFIIYAMSSTKTNQDMYIAKQSNQKMSQEPLVRVERGNFVDRMIGRNKRR